MRKILLSIILLTAVLPTYSQVIGGIVVAPLETPGCRAAVTPVCSMVAEMDDGMYILGSSIMLDAPSYLDEFTLDSPDLSLTSDVPFHCESNLYVQNVSYTRSFSKETVIGVSAGWETLVLPFDVQKVETRDGRHLAPFGSEALQEGNAYPFWLAEYTDSGFVEATQIRANVPYVISMPNCEMNIPHYRITGDVIFSAKNVVVHPTDEAVPVTCGDYAFVPTYDNLMASPQVYAINDEAYYAYLPGGVFASSVNDVRPFEAYLTPVTDNGARCRFVPVMNYGESNGIVEHRDNTSTTITYNIAGQRLDTIQRKSAVYIVNGRKVVK